MVNFQDFQISIFRNEWRHSEILKRAILETLGFLKERRAFNLGDGKFSGITKMGISEFQNLGDFEIYRILKEGKVFNLGDGNISGFSNFNIQK